MRFLRNGNPAGRASQADLQAFEQLLEQAEAGQVQRPDGSIIQSEAIKASYYLHFLE